MSKRPHIIIINPDEMRWNTMGHMGNAAAHTPALDRFAREEAVSFRNAYCQNPVCVPSRCSFFTGLYPHTTGHRTMGYLLRGQETSLLKELKEAGYYVWANARNDLVAGQIPGLVESHVTELFCGGNCPPAPGPADPSIGTDPADPLYRSFYKGRLASDPTHRALSSDEEDVQAAVERILHRPDDRPLCLFLGLQAPHPPYQVEEPWYSLIDRSLLPPRIRADQCTGPRPMEEALRRYMKLSGVTEGQWDELRAVYLAMCAKVDALFDRVCRALRQADIYDDSAIFFLSDHGDYAGDYGIVEKAQNCFEDDLVRVPLLIKPPRGCAVDPGITDSFAELVDFYATALDYAGVASSHSHFGRSLRGVVAQRDTAVREFACCEGGRLACEDHCSESVDPSLETPFCRNPYWPRYAAQHDGLAHAKGSMIRTDRWKYVYRAHGAEELYDLAGDPLELHNIAGTPQAEAVVPGLKDRLLGWYQDTCDVVPFDRDNRFSPEMIWEKCKQLCPPGCEAQVRQKIAQCGNLFAVMNYCRSLAAGEGDNS